MCFLDGDRIAKTVVDGVKPEFDRFLPRKTIGTTESSLI